MKKILAFILQSALLLICCAVGSFVRPFHIEKVTRLSPGLTYIFVWDGFLLMAAVYLVIVLIESVSRRLKSVPMTTLALALATVLSVAIKLGRITQEL